MISSKMHFQKPVIISGCHRSGTSLLTKVLASSGVFMGKRLRSHYEAEFFFQINEWALNEADAHWSKPEAVIKALEDQQFLDHALEYVVRNIQSMKWIRQYCGIGRYVRHYLGQKTQLWGWKDPRTTVLLPIWCRVFPDSRIIHIYRNGVDVAQSMVVRERKRKASSPWQSKRCSTLQGAFDLWIEYEEAVIKFQREFSSVPIVKIAYEDFVLHPQQTLETLSLFLNFRLTPNWPKIGNFNSSRIYSFCDNHKLLDFYESVKNSHHMILLGYNGICQ